MNTLYLVAFSGSMACIMMGLYVISLNRFETRHRLLFLICLSLSILNLVFIPAYTALERRDVFFWTQIASCCVNTFYALNLHFHIDLVIKRKLRLHEALCLYLPPLVIIFVFAINPLSVLDYVLFEDEWKLVPNYRSFWFYAAAGYVVLYVIATLSAIVVFRRNAVLNKEKSQAKLLVANLALSTTVCAVGIWIVPFFNYTIPNIGPTFHLVYVAGLFYSVFHFRFMELKPSIVAGEIISGISDMVLLLDRNFTVLSANRKTEEILARSANLLAGESFADLVEEREAVISGMRNLLDGGDTGFFLHLNYISPRGPVLADTAISRVTDKFSDIIGFLVISKENRGRKRFQVAYRITDRELEIIDLTLAGLSSREIGQRLGISDRTVQSHQEHVYQKLGIAGKVELLRLAHRFNLSGEN